MLNNLIIKEDKTSFLQKYKTRQLIDLISRFNKKRLNKKEITISINIVSILAQRYKAYQTIIKKYTKKSPSDTIDDILFLQK